MNLKPLALTIFALILLCSSCSQIKNKDQHTEPSTQSNGQAQIFAPGVISNGHAYGISFEKDMKTAYFTYIEKGGYQGHIYRSKLKNNEWSEPQLASFSGQFEEFDPNISPDFKYMFIMTSRPLEGQEPKGDFDIWYLENIQNEWVNPQPLSSEVNSSASEGVVSMTNDGWIYYFSMAEKGYGRGDIYKAKFNNGLISDVQNIGPQINSEFWEGHNYITPDGKVLLFYSNKPTDTYGGGDLYVSYNLDGNWSTPENLGPNVNTELPEITPYISPDMKYLFFGRIHEEDFEDTEEKQRSIWYIKIEDTNIKLQNTQ